MNRAKVAGHAILLSVTAYIVFAFVPMLAAYVHAADHVAYLDPVRMAALWLGSYLALLVIGWAISLVFFPLTHNPRAVAVPRWDDDAAALPAAAEPYDLEEAWL